MSEYGEFAVARDPGCHLCMRFSDEAPPGLDKFGVLGQQEFADIIGRLNDAYAPSSGNCASYFCCPIPVIGILCIRIAQNSRTRRLLDAIVKENAALDAACKRMPVEFAWTVFSHAMGVSRPGTIHASSRLPRTLVVRVGTKPVLRIGGPTVINNNITVIQGNGNTVTGATNTTNLTSTRTAQVAVATSPIDQAMDSGSAVAPMPASPIHQSAPVSGEPGQTLA